MPSTSLNDLHPQLRAKYLELVPLFKAAAPGRTLVVTCTYRSVAEQLALYREGRTERNGVWVVEDGSKVVTYCDGSLAKSEHNYQPARALDVAVTVGGKITWDYREYLPIGLVADKVGLVWGGNWSHLKDYPHLQLP